MNKMRRRKFEAMSLSELWRLRDDLQNIISELENSPRREIDIATNHTGDPALIARILRVDGDKSRGKWFQVERIFCSIERCADCPHGDFWYEYSQSKKHRTTKVKYRGKALNLENLRFFRIEGDQYVIDDPVIDTEVLGNDMSING